LKEAREHEGKFEVRRDSLPFRRNVTLGLSQWERTCQKLDCEKKEKEDQEVGKFTLPNQFASISRAEQFRDYFSNLRDGDIPQLIDYLDNVNIQMALPDSDLIYDRSRFCALSVRRVLLSRSTYPGLGGHATLGRYYRHLA